MSGIHSIVIHPSDPGKIEHLKMLLDEDATYFFEDEEGLHLTITFNDLAHFCDLADRAGFDSSTYREKHGL